MGEGAFVEAIVDGVEQVESDVGVGVGVVGDAVVGADGLVGVGFFP